MWQDFGSSVAAGVAFVRRDQEMPQCELLNMSPLREDSAADSDL